MSSIINIAKTLRNWTTEQWLHFLALDLYKLSKVDLRSPLKDKQERSEIYTVC